MGTPFALVNETSREEFLSGDFVRAQKLSSKALQDELRWGNLGADAGAIAAWTRRPTWTPVAASFNVTLGDAEALAFDAAGVTADESPYQVLAWAALPALVFGAPDPVNPRIDLVVATPATLASDVVSRNILTNPSTRSQSPANVPKTSAPSAAVAVVAGTAAGTPAPPAVPAGSVALYEVWIPAAAADSSAFLPCPRLHRRAPFPYSTRSALLSGPPIRPLTFPNPAAASALVLASTGLKVLIDGELIEATPTLNSNQIPIFVDSGNSPFAAAAPANSDKPYYFYACGGRHLPQGGHAAPAPFDDTFEPLVVVESQTAPGPDGVPQAFITTPRGTTRLGAVLVAVGFVFKGTTNRRALIYDGDWVFAPGGDLDSQPIADMTANATVSLASKPSGSGSAEVSLQVSATSAAARAATVVPVEDGAPSPFGHIRVGILATIGGLYEGKGRVPVSSNQLRVTGTGQADGGLVVVAGWSMAIPRMGSYL
jgi:hypothetical protein